MKDPRPQPIHRRDYRPPDHWIDTVDLEFELDEAVTRVRATLSVRRNTAVAPAGAALRLDGEKLALVAVAVDGRELGANEYRVEPDALVVPDMPDEFTLVTLVEIEPQNNTELTGLYRSGASLCTQCEAEGFRRITYFLDRPDVMARYTTTIVADGKRWPVLLSNGNRVEERELSDGRTLVRWQDPYPKPCYLFALVAADLRCRADTFTTRSGRNVRLEVWVEPANVGACDHALRSLQRAMKWDEDTFGLEYDLDLYMIVAVSDFNMAAMENKGLNVFTATDDDYEDIEGVIAHEYFHNWTGNRVTCRDWFQLTLKEGLTVFRDEQFTADMTSPAVKRIHDVTTLRTAQFAEDQSPTAHPIRPDSYIEMNNFYTVTVYNKGAEVVRMIHTLLGGEGFRRGMDLYISRHDGQAVTCDDFVAAMADAGPIDLRQFSRWYEQAGTPVVEVSTDHDAVAGRYTLGLRQRPPINAPTNWQPMHVPIAVGLLGPDGNDLAPVLTHGEAIVRGTTAVLQLREPEQRFVFANVREPPTPSLLRGFSAPVKLRFDRTPEELAFLMAHDADAVSRWDAAQTLGEAIIATLVQDHAAGRELVIDDRFSAAFGRVVADPAIDGSLRALMMALPDERVVAQHAEVVDVDGIHEARQFVVRSLAHRHRDALRDLYDRHHGTPYSLERSAIDARRAKNAALRYLVSTADPDAIALARAQFDRSDSMTDVQASLQCLLDAPADAHAEPLAEFYQRWRQDPLVLDKWFAVQAASIRPDTLARVTELRAHPDFNLRNPNRVRALLGTFSVRNQVRFHDPTGAGYRLLADAVLELDALNPQAAARLVGAFASWQRLQAPRREAMRTELARIVARQDLSKDVYELASKSLAS
jgi:aminopeptidase N